MLSWLLAAVPIGIVALFAFFNVTTMLVVALHLVLGMAICRGIGAIVHKLCKQEGTTHQDLPIYAAVILTVAYLGIGWILAHHVFVTHYTVTTDKNLGGDLKVALVADSHLGITLDGEDFAHEMKKVQQEEPDLVVLVGDFVDDDSDKADMLRACEALSELKTRYGVYFVYGNHDNGYFQYRNFSSAELRNALQKNGVTIIEDEILLIADRFYLAGRRDRSMASRSEAEALTKDLDPERYLIMLDHQPNDYTAEVRSGADLVLSGHTHGGHIFPAGQIGLLMHANDRRYGIEQRGDTTFIVTSGISGWAIPFKTGTYSEIVIIDILQN